MANPDEKKSAAAKWDGVERRQHERRKTERRMDGVQIEHSEITAEESEAIKQRLSSRGR